MHTPLSSLLRDSTLSFLPESLRAIHRPQSTVTLVRATTVTGILQFLLFAFLTALRFKAFALLRRQQWSPVIGGASDAIQVTGMLVLTLEFLIHPLSIVLIYFTLEGLARFISGLVLEHPLGTLPAFITAKFLARRLERQARDYAKRQPPDLVEFTSDGEHVRISSCLPKPTWNATITIGIQGEWYLVEKEEHGAYPHVYIYLLKRVPTGRVLRGYEEYIVPVPGKAAPGH